MDNIKKIYQPSDWHGLNNIKIELFHMKEGNSTNIFANSRNRVAVIIQVQPTDHSGNPISISREFISEHIYLVDYNTEEKLIYNAQEDDNFTWSYTNEPNEFTVVSENSSGIKQQHDKTENSVIFYVYCSPRAKNKIKQIAVSVKTPKGKYTTAHQEKEGAFIQLTPNNEIHYHMSDLDINEVLVATHQEWDDTFFWNQLNTYVSLKPNDQHGKLDIIKLENFGGPLDSVHQLYHISPGYFRYYAHFLWSLGEYTTVSVGNTKWFNLDIKHPIDIEIRQIANALCFTVIFMGFDSIGKTHDTWYNMYISIYDQFGNNGVFDVVPNNDNHQEKLKVHLEDHGI
ncbi:hypothetical protein [Xenorhabdus innexi]|uniref:Uncharacterized protein n=1 Tax=Xenorhabdus innexi TaxID=290109 RepID=A0A1N6MZS1_9GAMM|nr:hypothetical protein [Xenorhabdus innexi]PHM36012.1 hypothetical protein Xinn_01900 [Xenorhabdus innexi]SIP74363.1 hypothetical protein XIS1_610009 [Xenorhabdus innexi]